MKKNLLTLPVLAFIFMTMVGCDGKTLVDSQSSASTTAIDPAPNNIPITPPPPPPTLISELYFSGSSYPVKRCIDETGVILISELTDLHCDFTSNSTRTIDLSILDHFQELTDLSLKGARIYDLNLEKLPKLEKLDISDTQIRSVDVSTNTQLKSLTLEHNELIFLDLSENNLLTEAFLSSNRIGQLYLPVMAPLNTIDLSGNIIESNCSILDTLKAQYPSALTNSAKCLNPSPTPISDLNIENRGLMTCIESTDAEFVEALTHLDCESDREQFSLRGIEQLYALKSLTLNIEELANADLSGNPDIETITIAGDELYGLKISENTKLVDLDLASFQGSLVSYYDLKGNPNLRQLSLNAFEERPSSIDLSYNTNLETINIFRSSFTKFILPESDQLKEITLQRSSAPLIDLSKNPRLTSLHIDTSSSYGTDETKLSRVIFAEDNTLKNLYLGTGQLGYSNYEALDKLEELTLTGNAIEAFDLSSMVNLKTVELSGSYGPLDFSHNTSLERIVVQSASKTDSIDVSQNPPLQHLSIGNAPSIDISGNPALKTLNLYTPRFDSLDLAKNPNLEEIDIYAALDLREIDLSQNHSLRSIYIAYSSLESIDVTNATLLTSLIIPGNNIEAINTDGVANLAELDVRNNPISPEEVCQIIDQHPSINLHFDHDLQCSN